MNDLIRFLLLNIGKTVGVILGIIIAALLLWLGIFKTLFIAAFIILGFILGKWHDEGISYKKLFRDIAAALRVDKWH